VRPGRPLIGRAAFTLLVMLALAASGCGSGTHRSHSVPSSSTAGSSAPATATASTPSATGRAADFGADVQQLFVNPLSHPGQQLAAAAADGLGLARAAPLWEFTEPQPPRDGRHRYDWRFADRIAGQLAAHGLRWVALLAFAPGWASQTPTELHGAPATPADYAAYAAALARRYRGQIAAYEIWNEENSPQFWRPTPDPAAYARLYLAARAAIHQADPGVPVLIGGLANGGTSFLARLFQQSGLRGQVDGVAVHPYGRDPAQVLDFVRGYRLRLRALGAAQVPLDVTEYGWATHPIGGTTYAPASQQGTFISETAQDLLRSDCNVALVTFYAWTTAERVSASPDQWYGVASADGARTSATAAVADAAHALAAPAGATFPLCGA